MDCRACGTKYWTEPDGTHCGATLNYCDGCDDVGCVAAAAAINEEDAENAKWELLNFFGE